MDHRKNPICDICGEVQDCFKRLKVLKVKGEKTYMCKSCYRDKRHNHRNVTKREFVPIIIEEKKEKKKKEYIPKRYKKKTNREVVQESEAPIKIKGAKIRKKPNKSYSYLTLQEKQMMYNNLKRKGMSHEEADEQVKEFCKALRETTKKMKKEGFSQEKIDIKQSGMLEEMWRM